MLTVKYTFYYGLTKFRQKLLGLAGKHSDLKFDSDLWDVLGSEVWENYRTFIINLENLGKIIFPKLVCFGILFGKIFQSLLLRCC